MDTSQNPVLRLLNEVAVLIDGQDELKQAVANLDTRLQSLERAQASLALRIGEVPAAVTRVTRADVTEALGGLRQDTGNLREALRETRNLADKIAPGVKALEAGVGWRWDVLGFVVAVLLIAAPTVAHVYLSMVATNLIDLFSMFLGGLVVLLVAGFMYYGNQVLTNIRASSE